MPGQTVKSERARYRLQEAQFTDNFLWRRESGSDPFDIGHQEFRGS